MKKCSDQLVDFINVGYPATSGVDSTRLPGCDIVLGLQSIQASCRAFTLIS
jgi:hypothetical protein